MPKSISYSAFVKLLQEREEAGKTSAEFSFIKTLTEPKALKKSRVTGLPNPYKSISKYSKSFCAFNVIYQNSMNKALEKEGLQEKGENLFVSEPLPFGEWVKLSNGKSSKILIEHNGIFYIRATFNTKIPPVTEWFADGKEVSKDELRDYLPLERENLVEVRSFKVTSIQEIHIDKEVYILS